MLCHGDYPIKYLLKLWHICVNDFCRNVFVIVDTIFDVILNSPILHII